MNLQLYLLNFFKLLHCLSKCFVLHKTAGEHLLLFMNGFVSKLCFFVNFEDFSGILDKSL